MSSRGNDDQSPSDVSGGNPVPRHRSGCSGPHRRSGPSDSSRRRLAVLGIAPMYGSRNSSAFMELQDVQELSNFFERRVSAYQVGVTGSVSFDDDF